MSATIINDEEHIHVWGPVELSRFAGTPHRRCECGMVSLDLDDDEDYDDEESDQPE